MKAAAKSQTDWPAARSQLGGGTSNRKEHITMASRNLTPFSSGRNLFGMEPLLDIHREMNRLFDGVLRGAGSQDMQGMAVPSIDVHEKDGELGVMAELPGVDQKDVDVQLNGDMLSISGQKQSEYEQGDRSNHYIMERSFGRFQRTIQLPFAPKPDDIKANFENGVLRIRMPVEAARQARRIEIGTGAGGEPNKQLGASNASQDRPAAQNVGGAESAGQRH
jgi:HSP20 family protein